MSHANAPAPVPRTGQLAKLLERSRALLLERWKKRVLEDSAVPGADRLSDASLTDHVPALVDRLIGRLSAAAEGDLSEPDAPPSGAVALGVAHARQRAAASYSVTEGLRELTHFRSTVMALCREDSVSLTAEEAEVLHAMVDEMMLASARELDRGSLVLYQRAMAFVAHELRNPLSAIVMCAERLRAGTFAPSAKAFDLLARNAALMDRLVSDLLTVAKLEAGHFRIELADADMRDIVRDTCEQLGPVALARRIHLHAPLPSEPLIVHCDKDRIMQALGNLVANALKFTPEHGRVEIQLEADAERCTLRVADTGPGIAAKDAAAVFQPFWQAPQTSGQGTGLGLAIARGIIEAHGGSIVVERSGPGAVFAFTLPRTHRPSFVPRSIRP